ncbi:MAG: hypothetical protein Q9163_000433 [Psora crenata]
MSPAFANAEKEWLSQLTAMRQTIEDLKLNFPNNDMQPYGANLSIDDDDDLTGGSSSDDIWELSSKEEEDGYSSDSFDGVDNVSSKELAQEDAYGPIWLRTKCQALQKRIQGLDAEDLYQQLSLVLASDMQDDDLQLSLADIVGYHGLDFVIEMISNRNAILAEERKIKSTAVNGAFGHLQTKQQRESALLRQDHEHKTAALSHTQNRNESQYPNVYKVYRANNALSHGDRKYELPAGSKRISHEKYEEYAVPAAPIGILSEGREPIDISQMDGLCRRTFQGYKSLNRMQSLVYPVAYKTSENMLICAPTGAGKTDAAMLAVLNVISHYINPNPIEQPDAMDFVTNPEDFKVIYVAPMKALAAEITEKLGRRLAWLGIHARELTGDMHLTKKEITQTQIIVTTPEKWDVVTRKSTGDTELVQKVRLLIIDEVHMLHDERGAVIESLVARTQRQVESTQSLIRIIGLSATLPNYVDVADFLKVNRMTGLFYFDASFRPVPLEQHFIGVRGKPGTRASRDNIDQTSFEKVKEMLEHGHQVMVFVHSRKDTIGTARTFIQKAQEEQCQDLFDCSSNAGYTYAMKELKSTRGRELRELIPKGFGTHHAGMPRSDRNKVEQLFTAGHISVLCCTATLAWGVNLPAAAVIIKGTQLYSSQEGKYVDLGILDVLQIFGRAGRPQFQATGIGFICTTIDKLDHYISAVTQQQPIESKFSRKLVDNLNAEIALGTVTSVTEAVQWLGYSYLFVRMQHNPLTYGIDWVEIRDDPSLIQRRRKLAIDAARTLQRSQMIIFNETTEELRAKDVGRIASQYYVLQSSIEIFNREMKPRATEADVLRMICLSGEFANLQSRENELQEISKLRLESAPCDVPGDKASVPFKTNVLLQAYISRAYIEDFTLVSDTAYIAQNAARITRALFMIALNRRWGYQCLVLLTLCKSIEKQIWPYQHPFHQFDLPQPVLKNLDDKGATTSIESLREMEPAEIGQLVHNQRMGNTITKLLENFPTLSIECDIAPLNRDVLRIHLFLAADYRWNDRHNGTSEPYWVWVENSETSEIYHHEFFILTRKRLQDDHELNFTIPLSDPLPTQIYVRAVSDRWLGAETVTPVSFQHLIRPDTESVYTDLLDLQPLPVTALKNPLLEEIYGQRFPFFNPVQTQIFHTLYHTPANVLLGAPTGSGKTVAAELAMWWAFREKPGSKIVYIAPMKALVRERVQDWRKRLTRQMGLRLVELTGDNTPDTRAIRGADIIVTTPEKWDGISRSWQTRGYVRQVSLVVIDEIHLLGGDRGPILEIIVSRMNYIASQAQGSVRLVGMSTACANAMDLGNWLGVKDGLFNFRHSVRPVPLEIFIDGFPEQRGFCPLMQSMNRPTFMAIKTHSPSKPVIVFVASRRQTRLTAKDLINLCGMEDNPRRFVRMSEDDLQLNLSRVKDVALREALNFGIGLHHAGLVDSDRQLAEELFANNQIQILIATSTLAWGVNLPAHLVVVKGTQYFDAKIEGYKDMDLTDVLQMLGRAGRPQFDTSGIARIMTQDAKKDFYKHFLHTGFPVESSLHNVLDNHLGAEASAGTLATKQDCLDYLTWTFFFRRLHKNPSYYGLEISTEEQNSTHAQQLANDYMVELVDVSLGELAESGCIALHSNGDIDPTPLGKIMSYYYISHKTIRHIMKHATRNATFESVLAWICAATEFNELPVRHNEDLINTELSKNLQLKADVMGALPMWDPHVKAFLLLQAHFSRIDLPISDYVGDQVSVLDQSIRIIQASIDVLTELGYHSCCKIMITLLQCVKSGRWPDDGPLAILPGVDVKAENERLSRNTDPRSLIEAVSMSKAQLCGILQGILDTSRECSELLKVIEILPKIEFSVTAVTALSLTVSIVRLNRATQHDYRIYAPRYPKPQTEGYFVVVADHAKDEILAMKRVHWPPLDRAKGSGPKSAIKAAVKISPECWKRKVEVLVISDAYTGMMWKLDEVEVPAAPLVNEQDKGKKIKMSFADADPTGTLAAATSAINLVGAVLRAAPVVKNAANAFTSNPGSQSGPLNSQRCNTTPARDPERERRAYETVNYVLREFGCRICAAGLVDEHALTRALVAATKHIAVNLFSVQVNRLFESLAPKLGDPVLVNSIFTSIYFIGALTAELTSSLPNYKETYPPLGPKLVQQLFRSAIGEDAFKENLSANLEAYKTLAMTAGLLRPTDIGYSTFPAFPSLSTSRYSSKSFGDVWANRNIYEKLCKHFERAGFPQPIPQWQAEVGPIQDWRFLSGDANSRAFDVEKADKSIGENFGRVIHWLVCSADRMPRGQAVIVYYDQHIQLIRWIGLRMGYCIMSAGADLNLTGPHAQLDNKAKAVLNTWLILMPSERARAARQTASAQWAEQRERAVKLAPKAAVPPIHAATPTKVPVGQTQQLSTTPNLPPAADSQSVPRPAQPVPAAGQNNSEVPIQKTIEQMLNEVNVWFNAQLKPQCHVFLTVPIPNAGARDAERKRLIALTEREVIYRLGTLQIPDRHPAHEQRKAIIEQAQKMLASLQAVMIKLEVTPTGTSLPPQQTDLKPTANPIPTEISPSQVSTSSQSSPKISPPPYSPATSPIPTNNSNTTPDFPFKEKRPTVIRRKAPPPPKTAKALYDFEPEADNEDELAFKEGEEIEIVEKSAALEEEGWCRARVKGTKRIGLAPLEYLELQVRPAQHATPVHAHASPPGATPLEDKPSVKPQTYMASSTSTAASNISQPQAFKPPSGAVSASHTTVSPVPTGQAPSRNNVQPSALRGRDGPVEVKNRVGKFEVAGLSIAAVGAAAGVATVLQGAEGQPGRCTGTAVTQSQPQPSSNQEQNNANESSNTNQELQSNNDQGQSSSNDPNAYNAPAQTSDYQNQETPANEDNANMNALTNPDAVHENGTTTQPVTDPSAFSGGFEPQPPGTGYAAAGDQPTVDPYYAAQDPSVTGAPASQPADAAIQSEAEVSSYQNLDGAAVATPVAYAPPVDSYYVAQDPGFAYAPASQSDAATIQASTEDATFQNIDGATVSPFASMATPLADTSSMGPYYSGGEVGPSANFATEPIPPEPIGEDASCFTVETEDPTGGLFSGSGLSMFEGGGFDGMGIDPCSYI